MIAQFFTIAILMLLSAMLPGPDFALVTKNTISHSRRAGIITSLGIASACLVHITYCVLGLALVISQSILAFNVIKYLGAAYLIYIGIQSLLAKVGTISSPQKTGHKTVMKDFTAFRQGFLCNLLNPKATLFFLALFTVIIKPETPRYWEIIYGFEMFCIITAWFCSLTLLLSHRHVMRLLDKAEKHITRFLGVFLIGFGLALAFLHR